MADQMQEEYSFRDYVTKGPNYLLKSIRRWGVRRYRSVYFRRYDEHEAIERQRAIEHTVGADTILFLCWGNICRSPLAQLYMQQQLAENGYTDVDVRSAGLGDTDGRASPENAVAVGSAFGVDLSAHESKRVSPRRIQEADVVFVMDFNDYHSIVKRFPNVSDRVFFLGVTSPAYDKLTIPDPFGGDAARFTETYEIITEAIDELVAEMNERA